MDETPRSLHGTDAHRAVVDGMSRAFALAEVAARHRNHVQAADDITATLDDLEPELAELRALSRSQVPQHHRALEYVLAALAPLAICVAHHFVSPLQHAPVLPHTAMTAVIAMVFGWRPALVSVAVSVLAAARVMAAGNVSHGDHGATVLLVLHVATSTLIAYAVARPRFTAPRAPRPAPIAVARTPVP